MKRGGAAQRSFSLKQRWEVQLATQLTDFRVFTFQSFSVLLEPCVCFFVVQFQVEIVSRRCSRLVQVSGRMRHCVRDVTRVQSTITVALHLRWLLRRAAVAVLEAVHYHSSAPQSRKINRTEYSEYSIHPWKVQQQWKGQCVFMWHSWQVFIILYWHREDSVRWLKTSYKCCF